MEKKFRITVEGRQYIVTVEDISEGNSLLFPEPGSMQVPAPAASAPLTPPIVQRRAGSGPGDELSPLAGVIQSVEVSLDQAVKEGDRLVTLEAMKMTTTVFAHRSGRVTRIAVKPGDAVDTGQVLLTIT